MNGGAWERTAAYVNNGNGSLTSAGASLVNSDAKYKDVYTVSGDTQAGNYGVASSKKGDAVYETSSSAGITYSWYNGYAYMPCSSNPFFLRGSHYSMTTNSGIFAFHYGISGNADSAHGFRPVVVFD